MVSDDKSTVNLRMLIVISMVTTTKTSRKYIEKEMKRKSKWYILGEKSNTKEVSTGRIKERKRYHTQKTVLWQK